MTENANASVVPPTSEASTKDAESHNTSSGEVSKPDEKQSIVAALNRFISEVDALADTLPLVMMMVSASTVSAYTAMNKFLTERCTTEDQTRFHVPVEVYSEFDNVRRKYERTKRAIVIIPRSFLTSLVSHYDAFLGSLVKSLLYMRPELLNSSERKLSFKELTSFPSIDAARAYIVEKEVENLLRASHADQFKWLEEKFSITLRKELPSWPTFVEVMERRNLFVHSNGVVSSQYLSVCKEHGVDCSGIEVGHELQVGSHYFATAYRTIVEIGVKLAHVLWRKVRPDEMERADISLNNVAVNLIQDEKYALAQNLLDFASQFKKFGSETVRLMLVLNRAQAYKWIGQMDRANTILNAEDWNAANEKFQLGSAALKDDFAAAAKLMVRIGVTSSPSKGDYKEWPIFKVFRTTPEFAAAYKAVFGEPFCPVETAPAPRQELSKEASKETIQ